MSRTASSFTVPCRIDVEQSDTSFHAHVELAEDIAIFPGDRVRVHGEPIRIAFGQSRTFERAATVTRAGPLRRAWTRLAAHFAFHELYEVSFTNRNLK